MNFLCKKCHGFYTTEQFKQLPKSNQGFHYCTSSYCQDIYRDENKRSFSFLVQDSK
jgi:hypothetical protein